MRQITAILSACAALGMIAVAAKPLAAASQEKGMASHQSKACDVKTTEKAPWCTACNKILEKGDVEKGLHKGQGDDHKVEEVEVCVKKYYSAECHPTKMSDKPGS